MTVEEIQHTDSRNGKQCHKVHPKRQAHYQRDKQQPAVAAWLVQTIRPLDAQPKHHRHKEHSHSIYLSLYGIEPEAIRERISQRPYYPTTHYGYCMSY